MFYWHKLAEGEIVIQPLLKKEDGKKGDGLEL